MISSIIMASVVIALSFAVLAWSQIRTSDYAENYGETTDAEIARLKERLTVEYIFYNGSSGNLSIYLLNCGAIGNVTIESVRVQNDTETMFFNSTVIPDLYLDMEKTGCLIVPNITLTEGENYFVRIWTIRRSLFDLEFVA